jgi:hypothetical protein
LQRLTNI